VLHFWNVSGNLLPWDPDVRLEGIKCCDQLDLRELEDCVIYTPRSNVSRRAQSFAVVLSHSSNPGDRIVSSVSSRASRPSSAVGVVVRPGGCQPLISAGIALGLAPLPPRLNVSLDRP
jgi:hypothetical protein